MAAVMLQVIPSFFPEFLENFFEFLQTLTKKYIVCNENCVAFHNDKSCFSLKSY